MSEASHEITDLLRAWSEGDQKVLESLVPLIEPELRQAASRSLQNTRRDPILDTTALVNEVYVRLIGGGGTTWQNRAHFLAVCAQVMRRVLVDHFRARQTVKRGGGEQPISLDEALVVAPEPASDVLAIDEALVALARIDPRKSRVVELRFFGGLNIEETSAVLKVSPDTVRRDLRLAKAWLFREMNEAAHHDGGTVAKD